jgi:hypothetical protein
MHTLDDIMAIAPAVDNTSGALPAEVLAGKTFWSLRTNGAWGQQTGTMPDNGAVTYTPNTTDQPVAPGYHNGSGEVEGDADLLAGNIKQGVNLFGVTGTYPLAPVPRTGVTETHFSGDDGDLEKGVIWPIPRFADNGDGTVTDNLTGLIWLQNASCITFFQGDNSIWPQRSWGAALTAANSLSDGYCDLSDDSSAGDWRLPNLRELQSLIHFGVWIPAVPNTTGTGKWSEGDPFTSIASAYWSSTDISPANKPVYVDITFGLGKSEDYDPLGYRVWPVRGGQ